MAQAMLCDGCGERPAVLLITDIQTGEVLAFDVACSAVWAETHAKAILDVLGADYPGQLGTWLTGPSGPGAAASEPTGDEPAADAKPKRARRTRKPAEAEYDPNRTIGEVVESAPTPPDEHRGEEPTDGLLLRPDPGLPAGSREGAR